MALTNLSQVTSSGIHTLSNYTTHNINSTGIITATEFSGNLSNSSGISTFAEIRVTGNLTVEGTTTTLDSNLTEVDRIEVGANSTNPGIAVTQSGTGHVATFEGGNFGIGTNNPSRILHVSSSNDQYIRVTSTNSANAGIEFGDAADKGRANIVYANSDDSMFFTVNGSEKARISSAGRVGIGTNNPATKVHIEGTPYIRSKNTGAPSDEKTWDFNAGTDGILRFRNTNDAANSSNNWLEVERNGVQTDSIRLLTGTGTERLRIASGGYVGINETTPSNRLHVKETNSNTIVGKLESSVAYSYLSIEDNSTTTGHVRIGAHGNDLVMNAGANQWIRITSDGKMAQGGHTPSYQYDLRGTGLQSILVGSENAGGAMLILDGDSNGDGSGTDYASILHSVDGNIEINNRKNASVIFKNTSSEIERLRIASNGQVLIGNYATHSAIHGNLEVNGNDGINISNSYRTGTNGVQWRLIPHNGGGSTTNLRLYEGTGATEVLNVTKDGKIGISDTSPENTLSIKNIGSFEGDANSFYLGSNFTGTGQNFSGSGKHAQRFFFNNASSNGYLKYENTGTTGNAGDAITWQERFRITSDGKLLIGSDTGSVHGNRLLQVGKTDRSETYVSIVSSTSGESGLLFADTTTNDTGGYRGQIRYHHSDDSMNFRTGATERLRIDNVGSAQFTGQDSPSGRNTRISRYGSLLVATTGEILSNARCSIDSGNGNIATEGGVAAASVNLQSSSTSSWFQTGATYGGTPYVWAAKDSSANVWHSGLQTDGDLLIGGNITGTSRIGLYGSSGNIGLTNATTSAKLNVSTDIGGNYTGWKEKGVASGSMSQASIDSKTPTINDFTYPNSSNGMLIWSTSKIGFAAGGESPQYGTGVQMLFDSAGLMLGGNRAFDRTSSTSTSTNWNLKLNTSGSAIFKGSLEADPFLLDANDSWVKSTYGAISNSHVSSLNNLMIGQNMRGWVGTRDGGSATNSYYNVVTHGGIGYCGTEYCYDGITKFYNNTGGTTANATFTPYERVRITSSRFYSSNGFHFSNNSSTNNSLPNPYNIGNISSNNAAYPHTPGMYLISASSPCDNTWRTLLTSINDSAFVFEGISGDASSKRSYKVIGNPTSPGYGVNRMSEDYNHGAWNTGDIEFRLDGTHPNWNLQVKTTSYYNSSNNAGVKFILYVIY